MSPSRSRPEDPADRAPSREAGRSSSGAAVPDAPDRTQVMVDALRRLDELFAATVETLDLAIAELGAPELATPDGRPRTPASGTAGSFSSRDRDAREAQPPGPEAAALPSPAEHRVLELLPTTLTRREIADELHLSMNTVKSHTRMLYLRLGVTTRTAAVVAARERGLLQRSPGAAS